MKDIVLFLGAGFSYSVGLPLMSDFADNAIRSQPYLLKHANAPEADTDNFRHAGRRIRDAQRTFEAFRGRCVQGGLLSEANSQNLETVFCAAEALHQAGQRAIDLNGQLYSTDTILRDISLWIWKTYQQIPAMTMKADVRTFQTESPYLQFFESIRNLKSADRLTILTTNYDIVTEYYAWKCGVPVRYPFDWDHSFAVGWGQKRYVRPFGDATSSLLCKLHGSVNYFEDRESAVDCPWVAADIGTGRPIGAPGSQRYKEKPTILAFDAIWHVQKKYGEGFTPAIIPPSYAKLREKRWLTQTWKAALDALRTAETLIFIGYSLPPSDGFMTALFMGAAALRESKRVPAVHIIDTSTSAHEHYSKLFGNAVVSLQPIAFGDAVAEVLPSLLQKVVRN